MGGGILGKRKGGRGARARPGQARTRGVFFSENLLKKPFVTLNITLFLHVLIITKINITFFLSDRYVYHSLREVH